MGADVYIPKLHDPVYTEWSAKFDEAVELRASAQDEVAQKSAQKLVDEAYEKMNEVGYFRDSYNVTSVLWTLGLSWWQDLECDIDDDSSDINVSVDSCKKFLEKSTRNG